MEKVTEKVVFAAGAVCWRYIDGELNVLLIHRTDQRDISLPKGKVDPGETLPQTAVREIKEETGLDVVLGVHLGETEYVLPNGRDKAVHYWAAEVTDEAVNRSSFKPNSEVAALEWLPLKKAHTALTYDLDRKILDTFSALVDQGVTRTFAIIVLRHGKALDAGSWQGSDKSRPLTDKGLRQAVAAISALKPWNPEKIISSTSTRCRQTITPLAEALELSITFKKEISQHAFDPSDDAIRKIVGKRIRKAQTAVICSHGPVIPELVREVALATGTPIGSYVRDASMLDTAGFSVLHLSAEHPASGIISVETHSSLY